MAMRDSPMDEGAALKALEARVAALESANPMQRGTVDSGGQTRVAPGGVFLVDGHLVGGENGSLEWAGFVDFVRHVSMQGGFTANGNSFVNGDASVSGTTNLNGHVYAAIAPEGGRYDFVVGRDTATPGQSPVWLRGIAESSSASGLRAVGINASGELISVPFPTGGSGGDPGGGGDNPKGLIYPFPLSELGDPWGPRDYAPSPFHYGMDWPKPEGTPIIAAGDGTVIMAEDTGYLWGNFIRIDHGDGIWTAYAHIMYGGMYVGVGDTVTRGQVIAGVGTTGPSTGNHLHFELYQNGERVNPEAYIGPE